MRRTTAGLRALAVPLVTAPVSACGGGGGASGDTTAPPAPQNTACTQDSTLNPDGSLGLRTLAYLCGTYGITTTRRIANGVGISSPVTLSRPDVPDGDAPSFSLPYEQSGLGGRVALSGTSVVYTPPAGLSGRPDRFVYVATDGRGGVGAGVVTVEIGR